ncbi:MAG: HEAT repeat domain-containing protein [Pirellulales bacterium]
MTTKFPQGRGIRWRFALLCAAGAVIQTLVFALASAGPTYGQEAQWIWHAEHEPGKVPTGACHFRKIVNVKSVESATMSVVADDLFDIRINGRSIGSGSGYRRLNDFDISRYLSRGRNVIAVRVVNTNGATAAFAARVQVKDDKGQWQSFSTDRSWKTNVSPLPLWDTSIYNDSRWPESRELGRFGETAPWDRKQEVAATETDKNERFRISDDFTVQRLLDESQTGSLIAMAFNEFGHVVASREGGPLLLLSDTNRDQTIDKARIYCDKVKSCQGILPLNGEVFVTAEGPEGVGLYRLADKNRDGTLEDCKLIVKLRGDMGEHGPHAVALGPDGLLYVVLGNLCSYDGEYDKHSPHRNFYEGDLVPRYEDPGGHAVGIKAPGGTVIRTDVEGSVVQLYAGGLRNAYDLTFNRDGEMFVHDSDMETDEGTPWYRATQIFHVVAGGEYGWRSGWSRWPEYAVDALPSLLDTGRGSPTGCTSYNHFAFPQRYHNSLFFADWTRGRILNVKLKKDGGSYVAASEVFLEGSPLNVTDLEVGPDGALYFVTGGRGTNGGLYRVTWKGKVPAEVSNLGEGITTAIRMPQLQSAWARQKLAKLKADMGDGWQRQLIGVASSESNPAEYRTRALELLQLFGNPPDLPLLELLAQDKSDVVRAKAAELLGLQSSDEAAKRLVTLLKDSDGHVRRRAAESLARQESSVALEYMRPVLASEDRFESWAARRLLELQPTSEWKESVLASPNPRVLIQGALALMIAEPDAANGKDVIERIRKACGKFVNDRDFTDMLRVSHVAIHRGGIPASELEDARKWLAEEFPSGDANMNTELIQMLVYLQAEEIANRYVEFLKSKAPAPLKLHVAGHLRFLESGWKEEQKWELIDTLEKFARIESSGNMPVYARNLARDFARGLSDAESAYVLERAVKWPNAAVGAIYKLPNELNEEQLATLRDIDRQLSEKGEESSKPLQVGIVALLARSGDDASHEYLREIWRRDPDRRQAAAMGLAQRPDGENWSYLVRSLPFLEGNAALEVLDKLVVVDQAPEDPEYYRQVILRGLLLKDQGALKAIALLEHWSEETISSPGDTSEEALAAWQKWFAESYPDRPAAVLPSVEADSKWQFDELLEYLTIGDGHRKGSASRGSVVFTKAQCSKCHSFGGKGERVGPDLTTVSKRFVRKEILESILFPSHVISDQYASKTIVTTKGRRYTGMVVPGSDGEKIVLQANGQKTTIKDEDIEETTPSKASVMPAGLLNDLSQEEIADLFAYLLNPPRETLAGRTTSDSVKR